MSTLNNGRRSISLSVLTLAGGICVLLGLNRRSTAVELSIAVLLFWIRQQQPDSPARGAGAYRPYGRHGKYHFLKRSGAHESSRLLTAKLLTRNDIVCSESKTQHHNYGVNSFDADIKFITFSRCWIYGRSNTSFLLTCRLLSTHTWHSSTLPLVVDFCRHPHPAPRVDFFRH